MIEVHRFGRSRVHDEFLAASGLARLDPRGAGAVLDDSSSHLAFQFWGEHCTECSAPDCYFTCDLFERGPTGWCKRFADGIVVIRNDAGPAPFTFEVLFRPWGRLTAVGNVWCMPRRAFRVMSRVFLLLGRTWDKAKAMFRFLPVRAQWKITDKMRGLGNRLPRALNRLAARPGAIRPDTLVCVVGNPHNEEIKLEIALGGFPVADGKDSQGGRVFRRQETIGHGWHKIEIPIDEIGSLIDFGKLFRVSIMPLIESPKLLQIACAGLVARNAERGARNGEGTLQNAKCKMQDADLGSGETRPLRVRLRPKQPTAYGPQSPPSGAKKVKLLVMDLDNTVWDGIVVEDPDRKIELRPGVAEALKALDERGILLSVAGKGNEDDSRRQLELHGLWDLMLYPRINWQPKSVNIRQIVESLNIGLDSAAFIDDSEFELAEVRAGAPEARTYRAREFPDLPERAEFDVPVTEDSRRRRELYRSELNRKTEFTASDLSYDEFLASCGMEIELMALDESNKDRVFELIQRTNQLNFSGNRYTREQIEVISHDGRVVPIVVSCSDRFGEYGIVGFAMARRVGRRAEIVDMMFSCRVQSKKVEHGFLAHVLDCARGAGCEEVACFFTRTKRNAHAAKVFWDLGFAEAGTSRTRNAERGMGNGGESPQSAVYSVSCLQPTACGLQAKVFDRIGLASKLGD